jgi:DNA recombination protein RmuC
MLIALIALQAVTVAAVIALLLRNPAAAAADPRMVQLASDLPAQITRLDAQFASLDRHLRGELSQLRSDNALAGTALRQEVLTNIQTLGETLRTTLGDFRTDNTTTSNGLRSAVEAHLKSLTERFTGFTSDINRTHADDRGALHTSLRQLGQEQNAQQEKLRDAMQQRLDKLNTDNTAKLEEMRSTVDEKLHNTLQTRLTESFGAVTDQLTKVHSGLGEMTKLSAGVDDLSRIFTNVKSRGTIGEVLLENLLKQMLAINQYDKNVKPKPGSNETVEFCVKLPSAQGEMLLPIDSKFPRESGERLETAYTSGSAEDIATAARVFESDIRKEARKICDKYIAPPHTTSFAVMFLPTESLYAEVMRRDGLQSDIQQNCRVTIAGPSTLSAILTSFQMGFHMLQLQEKGDDVWKVLANARKEFGTFETLMNKMTDDIGKVQGTIDKLGVRTRAINRTLRDVNVETEAAPGLPPNGAHGVPSAFDGMLPLLAASDEE